MGAEKAGHLLDAEKKIQRYLINQDKGYDALVLLFICENLRSKVFILF